MLVLVIRTFILYTTVILAMRIMGKKQIGELQPSELVVAIMISDLASIPMQDIDIPLLSGIVPVFTLIVAEVAMSYLNLKSVRMRKLLTGEPSVIIYDGHINEGEMERLRFNLSELLEELRLNNCPNIADVEVAMVETGGNLSVIPKTYARGVTVADLDIKKPEKEGLPYIIVADGVFNEAELTRSGKDIGWLKRELKKKGITDFKNVFIASLDNNGEMFIQAKGKKDRK